MFEAVANGLGIALAADELVGGQLARAGWSSRSATNRCRCGRATIWSTARNAATAGACARCAAGRLRRSRALTSREAAELSFVAAGRLPSVRRTRTEIPCAPLLLASAAVAAATAPSRRLRGRSGGQQAARSATSSRPSSTSASPRPPIASSPTDFIEHNPNLPQGLAAGSSSSPPCWRASATITARSRRSWPRATSSSCAPCGPARRTARSSAAAAGRKLRFATADFFRIENGKLAEHWDVVDSLPRAIALGLVPPPKTRPSLYRRSSPRQADHGHYRRRRAGVCC